MPQVPSLSANQHDAHSVRLLRDFGMLDFKFDDADILRSRRSYYGSISYIDQLVGRLLETLKSTGADQNTAIIFTSDHGEMLGERGMWFKKHFFEPSLRIPLFVHAPWLKPQRIQTPASLVDLLPTFCGIATEGVWECETESLAGEDLTRYIDSDDNPERVVYAEYLAEATTAPIFMIRQGPYKYISCSTDPALLFNVVDDPNELRNLAGQAEYRELIQQFELQVQSSWNETQLTAEITLSQKRRQLVRRSMVNGLPARWNHGEEPGEKVLWYRGEGSYNEWAFDYMPAAE